MHAVTFLHVLHLDVLRGQIEIETGSKANISLCMTIMLDHPWQSLSHSTVVLCIGMAMGGFAI